MAPSTFTELVGLFIGLIRLLLALVAGLIILYFLIHTVRFIGKAGDIKEHKEGKQVLIWGVIALLLLTAIYGILTFFYNDFGFRSSNASGGNPSNFSLHLPQ